MSKIYLFVLLSILIVFIGVFLLVILSSVYTTLLKIINYVKIKCWEMNSMKKNTICIITVAILGLFTNLIYILYCLFEMNDGFIYISSFQLVANVLYISAIIIMTIMRRKTNKRKEDNEI